MANTYLWNAVSADFSTSGDWLDITSGTPVATPNIPGSLDIAQINSGTISGTGTADTLNFGGTETATGTLAALGSITQSGGLLTLSGSLTAPVLSFADLASLAGAVITATGSAAAGSFPTGVNFGGTVDAAGGTINSLAGQINVNGTATIHGGETAEGLAAVVSAHSLIVSGAGTRFDSIYSTTSGIAGNPGGYVLIAPAVGQTAAATVAQGATLTATIQDSDVNSAISVGERGSGTLTVTDSGSEVIANGFSYIGRAGVGALLVENGGSMVVNDASLDGGGFYVGVGSGVSAALTGGSGSATINSGGGLFSQSAIEVGGNGDSGALLVDDGTVTANTRLLVGSSTTISSTLYGGEGSVDVGPGGTLLAAASGITASGTAGISLAYDVGTTAALNVHGAGAFVSSPDFLNIGNYGTATATISQGGSVEAASLVTANNATYIGDHAGAEGSLTVTDPNSAYVSEGELAVGFSGVGSLLVQNGGQATAELSTADISAGQGGVVIAAASGGTGILTVTGTDSKISTNANITVGRAGDGTLNVDSGATAIASTVLDVSRNGTDVTRGAGTVFVDGISSLLSVGTLDEGGDASGTLSAVGGDIFLTDGGMLSVAGDATLGGGATLSIDSTSGVEIGGTTAAAGGFVVVDAGATLSGDGDVTGPTNLGGVVSATGGLLYFASDVTGAGQMDVAASSVLELAGSANAASALFDGSGTLRLEHGAGFTGTVDVGPLGGTIDLADNANASAQIIGSNLHITGNGGTYDIPLAGGFAGVAVTTTADAGSGTNVIIACFMQGTKILTSEGEVWVETLRKGDWVVALRDCRLARVVWFGHRRLDCRSYQRPADVWPVRVRAGALGDSLPASDLLLSPDHAMFADGVLVPTRHLINGSTIVQEPADEVIYYHVELAAHDVILAEGLPCESYLDTGNRAAFEDNETAAQAGPSRRALARASRTQGNGVSTSET